MPGQGTEQNIQTAMDEIEDSGLSEVGVTPIFLKSAVEGTSKDEGCFWNCSRGTTRCESSSGRGIR